jgi:flagellar biosynthesis/type III secretory pathway protein FliH
MTIQSRRSFICNAFGFSIAAALSVPLLNEANAAPQFYADGFRKGKTIGRQHGYEDGYKQAYKASYEDEILNGNAFTVNKLHPDYIQGYKAGYAKGYKMGYRAGENDGGQDGSEDAQTWKDNMRDSMRDCMENGNCS